MQKISSLIKEKALELIANGTVDRVVGWQTGEFFYDHTPAVFTGAEGAEKLIYDGFCGANMSKYLVLESQKKDAGKVLALLKPCDTLSYNQLVMDHRVDPEKVYALGIECKGMLDIDKIKAKGIKGITSVKEEGDEVVVETLYGNTTVKREEILLNKCVFCKGKQHYGCDEVLVSGEEIPEWSSDRFEEVAKLEKMTPDERFNFWRDQLSKCIRCNACRNVCPACTCLNCVFDNPNSGVASKANTDTFEENMFHIIRAFHVAGRCTDCGECSRVCPQGIPLHLLNRKFIKDINELYGEYQAGSDREAKGPLTEYTKGDCEPSIIYERGGEKQ